MDTRLIVSSFTTVKQPVQLDVNNNDRVMMGVFVASRAIQVKQGRAKCDDAQRGFGMLRTS